MSDTAALVPVPFYPPTRTHAGNAGSFFNLGQGARHAPHVEREVRSTTPDGEAGQVYDQKGLWGGESQKGWIVNIWV